MRSIMNLTIALITFLIGISVASVWNIEKQLIDISPQHISFNYPETDNRIKVLISDLSSENDYTRSKAEKELIVLGQSSAERRNAIIQELLQSIEAQDDLNNGRCLILGSKFSYWGSVTNIFAELKAREAIDLLIRTIHCGNGLSGSLNKEPSFDALFRIGKLAVPQLTEALRRESREYKDEYEYRKIEISHCLSLIRDH